MIRIYDRATENFETNGLGFLTDFKSSPKIIEALNGSFELTFDYAINGKNVEYLVADNVIKAPYDNSEQLFRIKSVTPNLKKISIYAIHVFYDLKDNFLLNVAPTKRSGASSIQWLLDHAMYQTKFKASGSNSTIASARYENKNIVEAILGADNCVVKTWNGEIERDNFNIIFHDKRGSDRGCFIKQGKNIKDITISIDYTTIVTRIVPIGKNGITIPEKYVDSNLINTYRNPIVAKYEFSDIEENEQISLEEAQQNLRDACKKLFADGLDKPSISVKVNWLELSKINEYREKYSNFEYVRLGDTVTVQALGYEYKIRVIKVEYDPLLEKYISFEIGVPKADFVNNQSSNIATEIQKNNSNILEEAKRLTTTLINSGFGGHVRIYRDRVLIMDTDDESTAKQVWQWNLNGFAHSSSGIEGPYEVGITMDGQIVGDRITTGTISADRIEGYNDLLLMISKMIEIVNNASGIGTLEMTSNFETTIFELKIRNACQKFPNKKDSPNKTTSPKGSYLRVTYEDGSYNRYRLPPLTLRVLDDVYDEMNINSGKISITKKIGKDENGNLYLLKDEKTTLLNDIEILLKKGKNKLILESFSEATFDMRYMITNEYTNMFATKVELNSSISILRDAIMLEVSQKIGEEEAKALLDITSNQIRNEVSEVQTITENNYQDLIRKVGECATASGLNELKNSVETLQSSTEYSINILEEKINNGVNEVITENNYRFSKDGLIISENGAPTGLTINESGQEVVDKTGTSETTLQYNGYVNEEISSKTTLLEKYKGQTVNYSKNIIFEQYLTSPNYRLEEFEDEAKEKCLGFFYTGGEG